MNCSEPQVVVALQARTNSSRLPGKVLLPICGMPLVVLAAKRAESSTWPVITLTSSEETDDYLCQILEQYGLSYFRGSLNNVLKRYVDAFEDYTDDTILVRLTADNVFPDATFIKDVVKQYQYKNIAYMCADNENSLLPYGFSAEVTRLGYLREALINSTSEYDLEHVTPYIRKNYDVNYYKQHSCFDYRKLCCTVDTLDDYLNVVKVFHGLLEPIVIEGYELIEKLVRISNYSKEFALGCAQLGFNYGITNTLGQPCLEQAHDILTTAQSLNCSYFDTARVYGESEYVIGKWLESNKLKKVKIITKLATFDSLGTSPTESEIKRVVNDSIKKSKSNLGLKKLDILMFHRANHVYEHGGMIFKTITDLKNTGLIDELGVSVQTPHELLKIIDNPLITYIQLPFNILDYRWEEGIKKIKVEKSKRNLNVHVRSIFFQGLLLSGSAELWERAGIYNHTYVLNWLSKTAKNSGINSIHELCLSYVESQDWVDSLVLGAETKTQLKESVSLLNSKKLSIENLSKIESEKFGLVKPESLDPSTWKPR